MNENARAGELRRSAIEAASKGLGVVWTLSSHKEAASVAWYLAMDLAGEDRLDLERTTNTHLAFRSGGSITLAVRESPPA